MKNNEKEFEKVYKHVATINNTSIEEVKDKIQSALDVAWNNKNTKLKNLFPNGKPTLEEFLISLENEISKKCEH